MKILNFEKHLLTEKLGVNNDIKNITEKIYDLIKDTKKSKLKFNGDIFDTTKIKINSIEICLFDFESAGTFESSDSKITEKGIDIFLNINKNYVTKETIIHELNHALEFYMIGKDKFIDNSKFLKIHKLSLKFIHDIRIEKFFELVYYSEESEINSYITESFYEIKDNIASTIDNINIDFTINEYNKLFDFYYKNCMMFKISKELSSFDFKEFEKLNSNNLVMFFNDLKDKNDLIDEIRISKSKFKSILYSIKDIFNNKYFTDSYYNKIDKSVTIENLNDILNQYNKRFKIASEKIVKRLSKLYDLILDDLKSENKIKI